MNILFSSMNLLLLPNKPNLNHLVKIKLVSIGKTITQHLILGELEYEKRLKHYVKFEVYYLPEIKNTKSMSLNQIKGKEGELLLSHVDKQDFLVLLDENGEQNSSIDFAKFIEKKHLNSTKNLIFFVGGAYGFSDTVYKRANSKLALSKMTFSHQMVRMIFMEQLYRAYTIIKGEPYHHM
jgi:23S rRNA (pseudouridine1915-N3)-methyltransferase